MRLFSRRSIPPNYMQVFIDFNKSLKLINDKSSLINITITRIIELAAPEHVYFFMFNPDSTNYELQESTSYSTKRKLLFCGGDGLVKWLVLNERQLNISFDPEYASIYSENDKTVLKELHCKIVFQLKVMNSLKGLVLLAPKKNGKPYSGNETEIIKIILDNAALAIENIAFFEEQKESLKKMYRADKLAVIGQLAAGAAHEIRNPLTSIRSIIQYVEPEIKNPEKRKMISNAIAEVDRINEIIKGLLSFSRLSDANMEPFDLKELLHQTISLISSTAFARNINTAISFQPRQSIITADAGQLKQVFLNVVLNAVEAICEEGSIDISVKGSGEDGGTEFFIISIKDTGSGITQENIDKVFDPFYTTKAEGTGLGLSISYGIVHKHQGELEIRSLPGTGTEVIIKLPVKPNSEKIKPTPT